MPDLILPEVDANIFESLRQRAHRHGQTPEAEAKMILREALQLREEGEWTQVNVIHNTLAATGRTFSDSTQLLREDRER